MAIVTKNEPNDDTELDYWIDESKMSYPIDPLKYEKSYPNETFTGKMIFSNRNKLSDAASEESSDTEKKPHTRGKENWNFLI